MSTVHVTLSAVKGRANTGVTMPVPDSVELGAETINSTSTSAASTLSTTSLDCFWTVSAMGGAVWIKFGASPSAGSGGGHLIQDGQTAHFAPMAAGEKIAVKDV
jgi:hypothetical protein